MRIPINFVRNSSGLLVANSPAIGTTIGTQYDNAVQTLVFIRPPEYASDDLILVFKTGMTQKEENIGQVNEYRVLQYLTGYLMLHVQCFFSRNGVILEGSQSFAFQFRRGGMVDTLGYSLVATKENAVPYIFENELGQFSFFSTKDGIEKAVTGGGGGGSGIPDAPADGTLYGRQNGSWTSIPPGTTPTTIVNDLTTGGTDKALSAEMGKQLRNTDQTLAIGQADLSARIAARESLGGYVAAYDFGVAEPAQADITSYVKTAIWADLADDHDDSEIFNGTRVVNKFDETVWILANTPETDPVVFSWEPAGSFSVALATDEAAGILRTSPDDDSFHLDANGIARLNIIPGSGGGGAGGKWAMEPDPSTAMRVFSWPVSGGNVSIPYVGSYLFSELPVSPAANAFNDWGYIIGGLTETIELGSDIAKENVACFTIMNQPPPQGVATPGSILTSWYNGALEASPYVIWRDHCWRGFKRIFVGPIRISGLKAWLYYSGESLQYKFNWDTLYLVKARWISA